MEVSLHRVLAIPELLDMIFGYLDRKSNVANAQVCKTWSNIALDVLWKDVDNLHRLFGLLCPMKEVGKSNYVCDRHLPLHSKLTSIAGIRAPTSCGRLEAV